MTNKHINQRRIERERLTLERNKRNGTDAKFTLTYDEKGKRVLVPKK